MLSTLHTQARVTMPGSLGDTWVTEPLPLSTWNMGGIRDSAKVPWPLAPACGSLLPLLLPPLLPTHTHTHPSGCQWARGMDSRTPQAKAGVLTRLAISNLCDLDEEWSLGPHL